MNNPLGIMGDFDEEGCSRAELLAARIAWNQREAITIPWAPYEMPGCCEFGHCRTLLGVPYGRLGDLTLAVRKIIYGYMPTEQIIWHGYPMLVCKWCAGIFLIEGMAEQLILPCSRGRCAGLRRIGTYLDIPRDIWLEIVGYVAHASSVARPLPLENLFSGEMTDGIPKKIVLWDRRGPYEWTCDTYTAVCSLCH